MKKHIDISPFFMGRFLSLSATNYFVATNDDNPDADILDKPFTILQEVQSKVIPGDTVCIRGDEYRIRGEQIVEGDHLCTRVSEIDKSGTQVKRICYAGYQDRRPIFNLVEIEPEGRRVSVPYVSGFYLHFRNFEIIKTQAAIREHAQSECIHDQGGNHNIYENLAMHDGMVIGLYLVRGSHNLVLNYSTCNNFDSVPENGTDGDVDGFGGYPVSALYTGSALKGCRTWYNSDDGFNLTKTQATYTIEDCWVFYNGYKPGGFVGAGDSTGLRAGGYGMRSKVKMLDETPHYIVKNYLAYKNKNKGFYANHHLGEVSWLNNTGHQNPSDFYMLNRKSPGRIMGVDGYDRIIRNNLSYKPGAAGKHIVDTNRGECMIINNSLLFVDMTVGEDDFTSLDPAQSALPRETDGSLPDIDFPKLERNSKLYDAGIGFRLSAQNL